MGRAVTDLSMVVTKSCLPNPYSFSNIFIDFSASDTRNFSKIVFLKLFHSAEIFTQGGLFGAPSVLLMIDDSIFLGSKRTLQFHREPYPVAARTVRRWLHGTVNPASHSEHGY